MVQDSIGSLTDPSHVNELLEPIVEALKCSEISMASGDRGENLRPHCSQGVNVGIYGRPVTHTGRGSHSARASMPVDRARKIEALNSREDGSGSRANIRTELGHSPRVPVVNGSKRGIPLRGDRKEYGQYECTSYDFTVANKHTATA